MSCGNKTHRTSGECFLSISYYHCYKTAEGSIFEAEPDVNGCWGLRSSQATSEQNAEIELHAMTHVQEN